MSCLNSITDIIHNFKNVFTEEVGIVLNYEFTLQLRKDAKPVFIKEREIPYALRNKVEKELNDLKSSGIISKIGKSDWGFPLVIISKANGGVRICVDYKVGVNPQLVSANYFIGHLIVKRHF